MATESKTVQEFMEGCDNILQWFLDQIADGESPTTDDFKIQIVQLVENYNLQSSTEFAAALRGVTYFKQHHLLHESDTPWKLVSETVWAELILKRTIDITPGVSY